MDKEKFSQAVLESAGRLIARALEADLEPGIWDLQLIHTTSILDHRGKVLDICEYHTLGEELIELADGSWQLEEAYSRKRVD